MAGFDPDAYLKKTEPTGFDPDAYLRKVTTPAGPKHSKAQTALESYGNAATMGYLPEIQALAEKAMPDPSGGVDAKLKAQGFKIGQPGTSYIDSRDANAKRQKAQAEENPWSAGLGTVAGIGGGLVTAGPLMRAVGAAAPAATAGGRIAQGIKGGAALGAVANPGRTEGEFEPLQIGERAAGAALGAGLGGAFSGAVETAGPLAQKAQEWLRTNAAEKAYKALGRPTPTVAKKLTDSGQHLEIGRTLLDENAIPILGTSGRINSKVEVLKDKAGERFGQLLDQADANKVQFTPIKIKIPKKPVQVQEEVRMTPIRIDENPAKRAFPWLRDVDAPPTIVRGEEQAIQKALFAKGKPEVIRGKPREVPAVTVDTQKIASSILDGPEVAAMRKIPGMEGTVSAIEKQVETLAKNGQLTLRQAQELRQGIDKSIKFNKAAPEMRGAQEGLYMQRTALRDAMNEGVNKMVPGAGKDALKKAGATYNNLATASEIGEKQLAREATNRSVSLTDTIAGAAGLAQGGPLLSVALAAANKAGRTFGNSVMARGSDAAAKVFGATPALTAFAKNNPVLASTLAARIAQPTETNSQYFQELENPQIMTLFKQNPELIEAVQDPKLKAAIQKRLSQNAESNANRKPSDR